MSKYARVDVLPEYFEKALNTFDSQNIKWQLLKTFLGGWATNKRFGHEYRCCVFGCGSGGDDLEHYLECNILWPVVSKCIHGFLAHFDWIALSGLSPESGVQLIGVACACLLYHDVKDVGVGVGTGMLVSRLKNIITSDPCIFKASTSNTKNVFKRRVENHSGRIAPMMPIAETPATRSVAVRSSGSFASPADGVVPFRHLGG
eukprot:6502113-Karenia_brevis.AAC.1